MSLPEEKLTNICWFLIMCINSVYIFTYVLMCAYIYIYTRKYLHIRMSIYTYAIYTYNFFLFLM